MAAMTAAIAETGYPGLQYFTQERAEALLATLRPGKQKVGKNGKTRAEILDAMCAAKGCEQHRAAAEKLILQRLKVGTLDEVPERDLQLAYDALNQLMQDREAFGIVMERALMEVE